MTMKDLNVISKHFTDRGRGQDMQIVKAYLSIWEMGKPVGEGGGGLQKHSLKQFIETTFICAMKDNEHLMQAWFFQQSMQVLS